MVKLEVGENEASSCPPERVSEWKVEGLEAKVRSVKVSMGRTSDDASFDPG